MSSQKKCVLRFLLTVWLMGWVTWGPAALAQAHSVLTGVVTDASTGNPVEGTVVWVTSPTLQGEQVVVTDASGRYRMPQLPPGTYQVSFAKESYRFFSREDVLLRKGYTVRLNVQLQLEPESDLPFCGPPTIDISSTHTGTRVDEYVLRALALIRPDERGGAMSSFESLAELAPGAQADAFGVSLSGTTSPENTFRVDGLEVGSPALGLLGTPLPVEFIREVEVVTGGMRPEFGRATGGVVTVTTKSGSNAFHGSVFSHFAPGLLEGPRRTLEHPGEVGRATQRLWNQGNVGAELGGPLIENKLWFYAGLLPTFDRRLVRPLDISGAEERTFSDHRTVQYIGKLTYILNADHALSLSMYGAPSDTGGNDRYGDEPSTHAEGDLLDSRDVTLKLNSAFLEKSLFLDVTAGWHHQQNATPPVDGWVADTVERFQVNATGTWLWNALGNHYLKAGLDVEAIQAGPSTMATSVGGFVQDSWILLGHVTLNAGVRYDTQTLLDTSGSTDIALPHQVSPRLGLVYDFTRDGRSKLYASYGRYHQNATQTLLSAHAINSPMDPALEPQSLDELLLGGEYNVWDSLCVGATYMRRSMNAVIENMSRDDATGSFLGNPGRGLASEFPAAVRDHDAVTVYLRREFRFNWQAMASYTWSNLRGNYSGLFRPENNQLAPNVTSDFDLLSLTENRMGPLGLDRTHAVRLYGSRDLSLTPNVTLQLGLAYRGLSGTPLNVLGSHPSYGAGHTFILPRGSGGRLPWVHSVDGRMRVNFRLSRGLETSLSLDAFNLFNFQAVTAVDENYTFDAMDAIVGGTEADLATARNLDGDAPELNPLYGKPLAYQAPRSIRLGARVSF